MEEFEAIPELYLRKILPLSYEQIVEGCMHKDSTIYPFCDKIDFWKQKLEYDMGEMSPEEFFIDSCKKDRLTYVVLLINFYDINPHRESDKGPKAAIDHNSINVIKFLLNNSFTSSYNLKNFISRALISATQKGYDKIIEMLLKKITITKGLDSLEHLIILASRKGYDKVIKVFLDDGRIDPSYADNRAIVDAYVKGYDKVVKLLIQDERIRSLLRPRDIERYEEKI